MKQYIDKTEVITEIESKKKRAQILGDNAINSSMKQFYDGMKQGCVDILSFINTLEVKEEVTTTNVFIDKACEWLKCQDEMVGISFTEDFIVRFKDYMKGE